MIPTLVSAPSYAYKPEERTAEQASILPIKSLSGQSLPQQ